MTFSCWEMRAPTTGVVLILTLAVVFCAGSSPASARAGGPPSWDVYESSLLDVKFAEGTKIRVRDGRPHDEGRSAARAVDLDRIVQSIPGGRWERGHSVSIQELERIRAVGVARSGRSLPELELYQRVALPPGLDAWRAKQILLRSPLVEGVYFVPRPIPSPAAPDYSQITASPHQAYVDAAPSGVDARHAWSLGWAGQGISICDVEYSFNGAHVDLPEIRRIGGVADDPFQDDNHGTAVFGIMVGRNDDAGVRGIAHAAGPVYFAPANTAPGNFSVARALTECIAALEPGDVILIEQQTVGPNYVGDGQNGLVPTEWDKPVYDAIRTAVANDIVVVEASGNGAEDLDAPEYSSGHDDHWPFLLENDSGAIIVTGGSPTTPHGALFFTNFGATVDLQGWGLDIVTTGYGDLNAAEGTNALFTRSFGGSSGASPIVAGAVAVLQSAYKASRGTVLPAAQVRSLLRSTGTVGDGVLANVPLPNVHGALDSLLDVLYVDDSVAGGSHDGSSWVNAYGWLPDALAVADPGTVVMVAEGVYFPAFLNGPRTNTFQLENGVALLGGFPNGGGDRDPGAHPTFLSGNISAGVADSYHVVTGSGTDPTAILDGFTVDLGRADGASPHDAGAGLLVQNGSPTIRQSRFSSNTAIFGGGAFVGGGHPSFVDVVFEQNGAVAFGGGMYASSSDFLLDDVAFIGNQATGASAEGGGLFTTGNGVSGATPLAQDLRFHGNTAFRGGALSNWPGSKLSIDNAVFSGNGATDLAGAILNFDQGLGGLRLNNVTLAGNHASAGGAIYAFDPMAVQNGIFWGNGAGSIVGSVTLSKSIVEGGFAGTGVSSADPRFRDADGADGIVGTPDDDLRLAGTSPVIDSGDDCTGADIAGHLRFGICDQGAHEYLGDPGTFWSNGEVDSKATGESFDQTPLGGTIRQSADDFTVPVGQVCDVTGIRAVLVDPTATLEATLEIHADAGGVPGSLLTTQTVGSLPDGSLGTLAASRLWQYSFDFPPLHLAAGRYWASVYGKQEVGSLGSPAAVSAGDGTIKGLPYQFRQVGFAWVDGGIFFGSASRDLALDVDATCVPEPSLGAQLAAGLMVFGGLGARRRSSRSATSSRASDATR